MRVLIVEDNERISNFLQKVLVSQGHSCVQVADGKKAFILCMEGDFEIILLDLMLPNISGLDLCQQLRMQKVITPIIMLTVMDAQEDIISGFKVGADDYMTKPFAIDELLVRMDAISRRIGPLKEVSNNLEIGNIQLNRTAMRVMVDGRDASLTAREFSILELLMSYPGRLFSRERILSNIWGVHMDPLTNIVDVYIGRLRRKVCNGSSVLSIETVRGMGYRLNDNEYS